jgi:phytoene synthase
MSAAGNSADASPQAQSVLEAARAFEHDRYLSALLAPADARDDLLVIAAFVGELRRIPLITRDAAIGEIRLQWWRDALAAADDVSSGHPVADAVRDVVRRRSLPSQLLSSLVEGFSRELYEDGVRDRHELIHYADETDGAATRLALGVLGGAPGSDALVDHAGRALALTRLALALPQHLAHGRLPLPAGFVDEAGDPRGLGAPEARAATRRLMALLANEASRALQDFRAGQHRLARTLGAAFLPLALVEPYLKSVLAPGRDVLQHVADISPLSRVARLWFAHWRGRV